MSDFEFAAEERVGLLSYLRDGRKIAVESRLNEFVPFSDEEISGLFVFFRDLFRMFFSLLEPFEISFDHFFKVVRKALEVESVFEGARNRRAFQDMESHAHSFVRMILHRFCRGVRLFRPFPNERERRLRVVEKYEIRIRQTARPAQSLEYRNDGFRRFRILRARKFGCRKFFEIVTSALQSGKPRLVVDRLSVGTFHADFFVMGNRIQPRSGIRPLPSHVGQGDPYRMFRVPIRHEPGEGGRIFSQGLQKGPLAALGSNGCLQIFRDAFRIGRSRFEIGIGEYGKFLRNLFKRGLGFVQNVAYFRVSPTERVFDFR